MERSWDVVSVSQVHIGIFRVFLLVTWGVSPSQKGGGFGSSFGCFFFEFRILVWNKQKETPDAKP